MGLALDHGLFCSCRSCRDNQREMRENRRVQAYRKDKLTYHFALNSGLPLPVLRLLRARVRRRGDIVDQGIQEPELLLEIDGDIYRLSQLTDGPKLLRNRVVVISSHRLSNQGGP